MHSARDTLFIGTVIIVCILSSGCSVPGTRQLFDQRTGRRDLLFPLKTEFDWKAVEKRNEAVIDSFLAQHIGEFEYYKQNFWNDTGMNTVRRMLHVLDFNGDGADDVVFNGDAGANADFVWFFENRKGVFKLVFSELQHIWKMTFKDSRIEAFWIQDPGCCCEYVIGNKVYVARYDSGSLRFTRLSTQRYTAQQEFPCAYQDSAVACTLREAASLRLRPVVDDTTEEWYCGEPRRGNTTSLWPAGTEGYLLASRVDTAGTLWWFAAVRDEKPLEDTLFYPKGKMPDRFTLGWIEAHTVVQQEVKK